MKRKNENENPGKPSQIRWEFGPEIPTEDFFEATRPDRSWDLYDVVEDFIYMLKNGEFLTWEAALCEEQGIPLNPQQEMALNDLISFNEPEEDEVILYINGRPRPTEPWYDILNTIAPSLLIEPYRTFDIHDELQCEGWRMIMTALQEYGQGLSLPPGVESLEDVVPDELRHKLWLQDCFDDLSGLGQDDELTLESPEEHYRIDLFVEHLRKYKASVIYFALTLESLLTKVVLPEKNQPIFLEMMQQKLGLSSLQEPLADGL